MTLGIAIGISIRSKMIISMIRILINDDNIDEI